MNINEIINSYEAFSIILIIIALVKIIVIIALILAVFNISKRQTRQDAGQNVIIRLLEENSRKQTEIIEQLDKNYQRMCKINLELEEIKKNQKEYIQPPIE